MVAELSGRDWNDRLVVLPGSAIGRDALASGLAGLGADVRRVAAYRNVRPAGIEQKAADVLRSGVDVVTFTSSSTVRNLVEIMGENRPLLDDCLVACIGPITAATAVELGLNVNVVADEATVEGLADALVKLYAA